MYKKSTSVTNSKKMYKLFMLSYCIDTLVVIPETIYQQFNI